MSLMMIYALLIVGAAAVNRRTRFFIV